jgi:hypothetical protein
LYVGMVHQIKAQRMLNRDESVDWIIQDFMFVVI